MSHKVNKNTKEFKNAIATAYDIIGYDTNWGFEKFDTTNDAIIKLLEVSGKSKFTRLYNEGDYYRLSFINGYFEFKAR